MTSVRAGFLETFSCLGDKCEDTCCKGWGMQLDSVTKSRYEKDAPELLAAVDTGEAEWIMRRDPITDYCVKFEDGLCGIHKNYGTDFLGDACHFFPRITRKLGDVTVQTASLSCPEIARLALLSTEAHYIPATFDRVPHSIRDYRIPELADAEMLAVHEAFLKATEDVTAYPERIMLRIVSVSQSLMLVDKKMWPTAAAFYLKNADARLPIAEPSVNDPFNLLHALAGLVAAAKKTSRPRLMEVIATIEAALGCRLDWQTVGIATSADSLSRSQHMSDWWQEGGGYYDALLKRWIAAQLSMSFFPFAGFGHTIYERAVIMAVRLATVKLALMSAFFKKQTFLTEAEVIVIIQSLSRFMDHLAAPELSLNIYAETGWMREARLRALLKDE